MRLDLRFLFLAAVLTASPAVLAETLAPIPESETGLWSPLPGSGENRATVQLVWDWKAKALDRRRYEFHDPYAAQGYDVTFETLDPATDRAGRVSGRGVMTWRLAGAPRYGADTIMAQYRGSFQDGRFEGRGTFVARGGLRYDGMWKAGLMDGEGQLALPNGDAYSGAFKAGRIHGEGRYIAANGAVYEGGFSTGRRHGPARVIEPNHFAYSSVWMSGREDLSLRRLDQLAQAEQDAPPDLAVSVSLKTEASFCCHAGGRMLGYASASYPDRLEIFPDATLLMEIWRGQRNIVVQDPESFDDERAVYAQYSFQNYNTAQVQPVTIQFGLENLGQDAATIAGAYLGISASDTDLQPALQAIELKPLDIQNLSFSIENYGWGPASEAVLRLAFLNPKTGLRSKPFEIELGTLDTLHEFSLAPAMGALGADHARLPKIEKLCLDKSEEWCRRATLATGILGKFSDYVYFDNRTFGTTATGTLDFKWRDAAGTVKAGSAPFEAFVTLGALSSAAECEGVDEGLDESGPPKKFELSLDRSNYRIALPVAGDVGQGMVKRWRVQLETPKSSRHRFKVIFQMGDGRLVESRPVDFQYFRTRTYPETLRPFQPRC